LWATVFASSKLWFMFHSKIVLANFSSSSVGRFSVIYHREEQLVESEVL
jgi:hypothetical protein